MPSHRRTLFLPDLADDCTEETIRSIFSSYGEIIEVKLKLDDQGRCSGFLRYMESRFAQNAKTALSGQVIGGRKMRILWVNKAQGNETRAIEDMATAQVHVSFVSRQIEIMVTELSLKNLFSTFGEVLKVEIKQAQVKEGLESDFTQSGYGFVHFNNTPVGIEAAVRAVHAFQRQTVERVTYDCNLSHRLQSMLDAQKAKSEGFVEIAEEVKISSGSASQPVTQSPALQGRQMQLPTQQQRLQQMQQQQGYGQQQPHPAYGQVVAQAQVSGFGPPMQRYSAPGTPQEARSSLTTTSSGGSSSARSSFTGDGRPRVDSSPYGGLRVVAPHNSYSLPPQQQGIPQGVGNSGSNAGGAYSGGAAPAGGRPEGPGTSGVPGPGGVGQMPVSGTAATTASATGARVAMQYPEDRLSCDSGDSFRSARSMDYMQSPSHQHLMYRNISVPSPHMTYQPSHPGTPSSGYVTYPSHPQPYEDVYQQQQQHMAAQGGYMVTYNGPPQAQGQPPQPPPQGYMDPQHYMDQQAAGGGYVYPMTMSPGMMYIPQDVVMSPINGYHVDPQMHVRGVQPHQQTYSPHALMSPQYAIQQQAQMLQSSQRRGSGYGIRSPPYGGISNVQPRYQGTGGGISTMRPGQYYPRVKQANSILRAVEVPREQMYGAGGGSGSTSPYAGSEAGASVSSPYPHSPPPAGMYSSTSTATLTTLATVSSAVVTSDDSGKESDVITTAVEVVGDPSTTSSAVTDDSQKLNSG